MLHSICKSSSRVLEQGESNTNGLGAVLGLFNAVGFGAVGGMALNKQVRDASNFAADQFEFLKIHKTKRRTRRTCPRGGRSDVSCAGGRSSVERASGRVL